MHLACIACLGKRPASGLPRLSQASPDLLRLKFCQSPSHCANYVLLFGWATGRDDMAVYVDNEQIEWRGQQWCHLVADSLGELHAFALSLGLKRAWFQVKASYPHYDVTMAVRERALGLGAIAARKTQMLASARLLKAELAVPNPLMPIGAASPDALTRKARPTAPAQARAKSRTSDMTPTTFVQALAAIRLPNVFNPYSDQWGIHDRPNAPSLRRKALRSYLEAAKSLAVDTIWMGRDLGYRGGRRTGLALTDEQHLTAVASVYPGSNASKVTHGPVIAERTAAEIWALLAQLDLPPLLWNVFPFHPHEPDQPFTNRRFSARELGEVDELNRQLIGWLGVRRIVAIGQDAAGYAERFGVQVECVRHPSYGGITDFRNGVRKLYRLPEPTPAPEAQPELF